MIKAVIPVLTTIFRGGRKGDHPDQMNPLVPRGVN
ncbi:hypothetical protein BH10PLA2_BH10PLA2_01790 [soil metagenome]